MGWAGQTPSTCASAFLFYFIAAVCISYRYNNHMGQEYRRTATTVSLINYHFVFCPRYRRKVLSLRHVCHVFRQKYAHCGGDRFLVPESDAVLIGGDVSDRDDVENPAIYREIIAALLCGRSPASDMELHTVDRQLAGCGCFIGNIRSLHRIDDKVFPLECGLINLSRDGASVSAFPGRA